VVRPAIPTAAAGNVAITEFPTPTAGSLTLGITAGPDGNLWFTEVNGSKIGRITTGGSIIEFPVPTFLSGPQYITAGPDGNLWFTEIDGNNIGRITTGGSVTEFPIPTANSLPVGIAAGPDGNLWFAESQTNKIGEISPTTHLVSEFPVPTANSSPHFITAGPDGNLWFTESHSNNIGEINPVTHAITEFPVPAFGGGLGGITAGPDGNLWFTQSIAGLVGKINPTTHVINQFPVPTANSEPNNITVGPDGNLWFAETNADNIGEINPTTHVVTEYPIPTAGSQPAGVAAGPDGNVWFAEINGNQIGRAKLPGAASLSTTSLSFGSQPVNTQSAAKTITVTNTGTGTLTVSGIGYGGANPGDFATTNDTCTGVSVPVGGSCKIGVSFTPNATGARSANLIVTDDANNVLGSTQTVTLSGTGAANADLALSLGATPDPVHSGKSLTYTITVANSGPTAAAGAVVTDTLPAQSRFASATSSQGSCITPAVGATGTLTCSLGSMANGGTATIRVAVTIVAPNKNSVSDTASVGSASFDPNPANNSATVTVLLK
jgi:uncharacterized repeat protein (TIGR01451 family)